METKTYEEVLNETGYLYWKTVGVSMNPLIKEGRDTILLKNRTDKRMEKYDVVLFRRPGVIGRGAYVLHRILRVNDDGTYWIVGDNCTSGEIVREENVIAKLDFVMRKNKKVTMDNSLYKAYVYLWCAPYPIRIFITRVYHFARAAAGKILRILKIKK